MSRIQKSVFLAIVCLSVVGLWHSVEGANPSEDVQRLKKDLGGADAERILEYLRGQMLTASIKQKLSQLIGELGSPNFKQRRDATRKLVQAGPVAIPLLRAATGNPDREIASRACRCISEIQDGPGRRFADGGDPPIDAVKTPEIRGSAAGVSPCCHG